MNNFSSAMHSALANLQSCADSNRVAALQLSYTTFPDRFGRTKTEKSTTWGELVRLLLDPPRAKSKAACPFIKLARFGSDKTGHGCLRHNANMLAISGVEGDYDGGEVSVDAAADLLAALGIEALFYTSGSHTAAAPRWRVLAPLSREHEPKERARLLAVLNGALGGILAGESFTDSQSYYFGRIDGADFEARHVAGTCLDTLDDLGCAPDGIVKGRSLSQLTERARVVTDAGDDDFDLDRAFVIASVTEATIGELRSALAAMAAKGHADDYHRWIAPGQYLRCLDEIGCELWIEYSENALKPGKIDDREKLRHKFYGFDGTETDFRAVFTVAQSPEVGWLNPRSKAAQDVDYAAKVDWTDLGNANLLVQLTAGDLRYVADMKLWIFWDGTAWLPDPHGHHAGACATRVAEHYAREAALVEQRAHETRDDKARKQLEDAAKRIRGWEARCRNKALRANMLAEAQAQLALRAAELDADPLLLGVQNGVVDLRTGQPRPAARDDLVTKRSPVEFVPGARCPRWEQFVAEITALPVAPVILPDGTIDRATVGRYRARPALAGYLKRMLGYALTGLTREQKLFVLTGPGSNGKSVLADVVRRIMGDYARVVASEFLMESRYSKSADAASPALANLVGARMALSSEGQHANTFDTALLKSLTGDRTKTARVPYGQLFEFTLTHKHFLLTNPRPNIAHLDDAIRGRLHLLPFDRRWNRPDDAERDDALPDGDSALMDTLQAEEQGILAWLVAGAVEYLAAGLAAPDEVTGTTRAYLREQDPFARWFDRYERCAAKDGTRASELLNELDSWWSEEAAQGKRPDNSKALAEKFRTHGLAEQERRRDGVYWGLRLKPQEKAGSDLI